MTGQTFENPDRLADRLARNSNYKDPEHPTCLAWQGARDKFGFGRMHTSAGVRSVHRVAWVLANGPIPPGKFVRHTCGFRRCIEPSHLFLEDPPEAK